MRRLLSFHNGMVITSVFMGILFTASSFTFGTVEDAQLVGNPPQKKVHRVKIIVNTDGKETKIDTTFNLPDEKLVQGKIDSVLQNLNIEDVGVGNSNFVVHRAGKQLKCTVNADDNASGDEQFDIFIQKDDSGKLKDLRKMIRVNRFKTKYSTGECGEEEIIPPLPPMPPDGRNMFYQRFSGDPFAFDTRDESVVSYEKKDIGDGLERITIVRKKQSEHPPKKDVKVKVEVSKEPKK